MIVSPLGLQTSLLSPVLARGQGIPPRTYCNSPRFIHREMGFPGGTMWKIHLPVQEMQETWVQSLGQEDSPGVGNGNSLQYYTGGSHGQRSLVGYSPWGHKELDTTEQMNTHTQNREVHKSGCGWLGTRAGHACWTWVCYVSGRRRGSSSRQRPWRFVPSLTFPLQGPPRADKPGMDRSSWRLHQAGSTIIVWLEKLLPEASRTSREWALCKEGGR